MKGLTEQRPGTLSIHRTTSGDGPYVSITLTDDRSRLRVVDLRVELLEFAHAITGLAEQGVSYRVNKSPDVGKKKEVEECIVAVPEGRDEWEQQARDIVRDQAADGWDVRLSDLMNHHNHRNRVCSFHRARWVS